ncbi:MAG: TatA/E family twin arginine-targeting protein translocase [Acidobacteriota bacterium]
MGSIGVPEMAVIFLVALVLFGPKKLPELGRTIGKAMTEFRRASNDLKATFDREMQTLERENQAIQASTREAAREIADASYDILPAETIWNPLEPEANRDSHLLETATLQETATSEAPETVAQNTEPSSTVGASEVSGAESHESAGISAGTSTEITTEATATEVAAVPGIEGTIPRTSGNKATPPVEIAEEVAATDDRAETLKNS